MLPWSALVEVNVRMTRSPAPVVEGDALKVAVGEGVELPPPALHAPSMAVAVRAEGNPSELDHRQFIPRHTIFKVVILASQRGPVDGPFVVRR